MTMHIAMFMLGTFGLTFNESLERPIKLIFNGQNKSKEKSYAFHLYLYDSHCKLF